MVPASLWLCLVIQISTWVSILAPDKCGVDIGGLRACICDVEFKTDGSVQFIYRLDWTQEKNDWVLKRLVEITFLYWDSDNEPIKCDDSQWQILSRAFVLGDVPVEQKYPCVKPPKEARFMAVRFGGTEVLTQKIALPRKRTPVPRCPLQGGAVWNGPV
jgi:hypothetical protein